MKNSLKISSNFSIPWLGAFIVTCVLLETSVCGSSLKKHRKKAKVTVLIAWDFSPFPIFTTSSISTNASQLWQIRIILELKSKPYMIFFFFRLIAVDCLVALHNYIREVVLEWIYHIQISAIFRSNKHIRMKFGRVTSSVDAGESLRSETWDKKKHAVVFILFLYCFYISQLTCLTESAKNCDLLDENRGA